MEPIRRDIGKIYLVLVLGGVLLSTSIYWFSFRPLMERLRQEHTAEIRHFLDTGQWLLESVLSNYRDLAKQSASRTAIRQRQVAYLHGEINRDALAAFSKPKLADAMKANRAIAGISRYAPDGHLLFSVGELPPPELAKACTDTQRAGLRLLGVVSIAARRRLAYCSPIVDRKAGHVGVDLLLFDDAEVQRVVDSTHEIVGSYAVVRMKNVLYWPTPLKDADTQRVLQNFLDNGVTDHRYILKSTSLANTDWRLVVVVNKSRFFAAIEHQQLVLIGVLVAVAVIVLVLTVMALRPVIRTLLLEQRLFDMSHRDSLTGLFNHAYLQELLEREVERAHRYGRPLSALMLDIDHFKAINDRYGHQVGDAVLTRVGELLQSSIRQIDVAARYGGEEFMILLPDTDSANASTLAERLRDTLARAVISMPAGPISVTVSIGVVTCDPQKENCDRYCLVEQADQAMYASKAAGRNRVTTVMLTSDGDCHR